MAKYKEKGVKKKPLTDDEIVTILRERVDEVVNFNDSQIAGQRAEAMQYYLGMPFGNEVDGRSKVVSRDEQEVIDWMMPSLMKTFSGSDEVVQISPRRPEESEWAQQATELLNYIYNVQNSGFLITYQWIQDALMVKNGIVKVFVEEYPEKQYEHYTGMSQEDVDYLVQNTEGLEILLQTQDMVNPGKFRLQVELTKMCRKFQIVNVPPEEFMISSDGRTVDDAELCVHRVEKTVSDLRAMGVPEDVIESSMQDQFDFIEGSPERLTRDSIDGQGSWSYGNDDLDEEASRKIWVAECYPYLDVDGDGYAELRRIVLVGDHIVSNEPIEERPFCSITPYVIAHKFYCMSVHDKLKDIQLVRSTILRHILDNVYANTNGRYEVVENMVNLKDLQDSVAGGYVRTKAPGQIKPLDVPQLSGDVYNMLSYFERARDQRSGVSDKTRGLDADFLHSNQAATSVNQMMTAAEQQIELIARVVAEVGFKVLFRKLYRLIVRHQDDELVFSLRGKFVKVNPASWREDADVVVTVGLGNGNKDQQLMHLNSMLQMTQTVIAGGGMGILTDYDKVYNILSELAKNAGYRDVTRFWLDPKSPESQQAQQQLMEQQSKPSPEDIKAQAEAQSKQSDAQVNGAKVQLEGQRVQLESQKNGTDAEIEKRKLAVKERELSIKEAELQLERERFIWERARDEAEYTLEESQQRAASLGDGRVPNRRK